MKQDSSWRKILDKLLPEFLAFYFPEIHAAIAFERGFQFLDKELQKILPQEDDTGQHVVDKLVRVYLRDGRERWLLLHIEIQGYRERDFAKRVYRCNYRIADRFDKEVVSLVLLTDDDPAFREHVYELAQWNFRLYFEFPMVKLLDYEPQYNELEGNPNPFAIVTRAFLKTVATQGNDSDRYQWKRRFLLELYHSGLSREEVGALFEFISVVMALPEIEDEKLYEEIKPTAEEQQMSLLAIAERKGREAGLVAGRVEGRVEGREEGREEGLKQAIADVLEIKFGVSALGLFRNVEQLTSLEVLQKVRAGLKAAHSLEEAEALILAHVNAHS